MVIILSVRKMKWIRIYKETEEDRIMEPYYYSKMNKVQQAAYHAIRQGLFEISDSIQIPGMEAEELYNVFFRLRLDHPEIFWATGYKYKYYPDSPNFIFIPEYLFDKNKIKEHQKALCDALGIWCMIAVCGNNPEKGIKYRHTWNIVRIGGKYDQRS